MGTSTEEIIPSCAVIVWLAVGWWRVNLGFCLWMMMWQRAERTEGQVILSRHAESQGARVSNTVLDVGGDKPR